MIEPRLTLAEYIEKLVLEGKDFHSEQFQALIRFYGEPKILQMGLEAEDKFVRAKEARNEVGITVHKEPEIPKDKGHQDSLGLSLKA